MRYWLSRDTMPDGSLLPVICLWREKPAKITMGRAVQWVSDSPWGLLFDRVIGLEPDHPFLRDMATPSHSGELIVFHCPSELVEKLRG